MHSYLSVIKGSLSLTYPVFCQEIVWLDRWNYSPERNSRVRINIILMISLWRSTCQNSCWFIRCIILYTDMVKWWGCGDFKTPFYPPIVLSSVVRQYKETVVILLPQSSCFLNEALHLCGFLVSWIYCHLSRNIRGYHHCCERRVNALSVAEFTCQCNEFATCMHVLSVCNILTVLHVRTTERYFIKLCWEFYGNRRQRTIFQYTTRTCA